MKYLVVYRESAGPHVRGGKNRRVVVTADSLDEAVAMFRVAYCMVGLHYRVIMVTEVNDAESVSE